MIIILRLDFKKNHKNLLNLILVLGNKKEDKINREFSHHIWNLNPHQLEFNILAFDELIFNCYEKILSISICYHKINLTYIINIL
jgi:hypothetical protein